MPKDELDKIGQVRDSQGQISRARVFNMDWIARVQNLIYWLGFPVRSVGIEHMLKPASLVPTLVHVMHHQVCASLISDDCTRMPLARNLHHSVLTPMLCLSWT